MTFNPEPFQLVSALEIWLVVFGLAAVAFAVAVAAGGLLTGGLRGMKTSLGALGGSVVDLFRTSPGRVAALASLTFRESVRRRMLLVFVIFALLFMFAGWFLSDPGDRPELQVRVHVAFVLTVITYLTLLPMIFLACFGIPEDIRRRSLHTVVTKSVRRGEVVLGRIAGYLGIATLVVLVMGAVGYVWIYRQVPEEARRTALVSREPVYGTLTFRGEDGAPQDRGVNVGDIWTFRSYVPGATKARGIYTFSGVTPDAMTEVIVKNARTGDERRERVLRLESNFEAFRTFKGDMTRGLYVQYAYVNPDTADLVRIPARLAVAAGANAESPAQIAGKRGTLEFQLSAIRSALENVRGTAWAKANAEFVEKVTGLLGATDPDAADLVAKARQAADLAAGVEPLRVVDPNVFPIDEFETNLHRVPQKLTAADETGAEKTVDLFEDLAPGGRLTVEVGSLDAAQYLGMAPPDLFIRTPDRPFAVGYAKAVAGIWLMTALVIVIGVTAGTFVKGPVATVLTLTLLVVGLGFRDFMDKLTATFVSGGGRVEGGGPLESVVRIVQHMNPSTEMPAGPLTSVIQGVDGAFLYALSAVRFVIPDFSVYNLSPYVANGFDVSWSAGLLPAIGMTLAFIPPCLLLGYFALKSRELESK